MNADRDDAIDKAQREGYCLLAVEDFCLTHNCGPWSPCGNLTCKHCRGDAGTMDQQRAPMGAEVKRRG